MSFLDQQDVIDRLYSLLPANWFPDLSEADDLRAVLTMGASVYANDDADGIAQFIKYVEQQARVSTASGFWLDLIAADYFGTWLQRNDGESDTGFRRRIMLNLLADRGTRCSLYCNISNLTSYNPRIIEFRNTNDCGSYVDRTQPFAWGGCAYNEAGAWGTMLLPYQLLIDVTRPLGSGIPDINGYCMPGGAYDGRPMPYGYVGALRPVDRGTSAYIQQSDVIGPVTDQNIYDTVARCMPAGTTAWTRISDFDTTVPPAGGALLDSNFYLDLSLLADDVVTDGGGAMGRMVMSIQANARMFLGDIIAVLTLPLQFKARGFNGPPNSVAASITFPLQVHVVGSAQPNKIIPFIITVKAIIQTASSQPMLGTTFILGSSVLGWTGQATAITTGFTISTALGIISASQAKGISGQSAGASLGTVSYHAPNINTSISGIAVSSALGILLEQIKTGSLPTAAMTSSLGSVMFKVAGKISGLSAATGLGSVTTQSGVAQTLSATHKNSNITLSNGNLTASQTGNASNDWSAVYASKSASSGKFYWETVITTADASNCAVGFGSSVCDTSGGSYTGAANTETEGWIGGSQAWWMYNNNSVATWGAWNSGDRVCIALDITNKKVWGRVNNGNWNNSGTANPATGVGGYDWSGDTQVAPNSPFVPGFSLYTYNDTGTVYFASNTWSYSAPSGFGGW